MLFLCLQHRIYDDFARLLCAKFELLNKKSASGTSTPLPLNLEGFWGFLYLSFGVKFKHEYFTAYFF